MGRTAGRRACALPGRALAAAVVAAGLALGGAAGPALAASGTTAPTTPPTTPTGSPVVPAKPPACANAIQVVVGTATSAPTPIAASASTIGGARLSAPGLQVSVPSGTPAPPVVAAAGWVIADMTTGDVVASCNAHAQFMPASTLKILTALALQPKVDPKSTYVALPADAQMDGTKVGLSPGSTYTGDDLWHGLLMSSGNDAAHALADLAGGPTAAAELMAAEARRLGALDTVPVNTSGLDAPGQVTSAYDLALLGRELLTRPYLAKVVGTRTYSFPGKGVGNGGARPRFQIQSHNRLLGAYPGTTGVKNGYTVQAGGSFVGSATRAGKSYVVTVLRADGRTSDMAQQMLDWAFASGSAAGSVGRLVTAQDVTAGLAGSGPGVLPTQTPTVGPTTGTEPPTPTATTVFTPTPTLAGGPTAQRDSSTADAWAAGVVLGAVAAFGLVSAVLVLRRARLHRAGGPSDILPGLLTRRLGTAPRVSGAPTKGTPKDGPPKPKDDPTATGAQPGRSPEAATPDTPGTEVPPAATPDAAADDAAPKAAAGADARPDAAEPADAPAADRPRRGVQVPVPVPARRSRWGRAQPDPAPRPADPATSSFPELADVGLGARTRPAGADAADTSSGTDGPGDDGPATGDRTA